MKLKGLSAVQCRAVLVCLYLGLNAREQAVAVSQHDGHTAVAALLSEAEAEAENGGGGYQGDDEL